MASPLKQKKNLPMPQLCLNKFFLHIYCKKKTFSGQLAFRTNFSYTNIIAQSLLSAKDCDKTPYWLADEPQKFNQKFRLGEYVLKDIAIQCHQLQEQSKKDPRGCPICGKEKCVITNHQNRITKHHLAKDFPDIADEWDYTRNKIMPSEVSPHSHQKVWWKCKKCGHIWQSTISSRTGKTKNGCPCCNGGIAKRIGCFDKEENPIMFFDSARQATNKFDVEPSFVCSCCRNEKWALGYHWKYIVNN